MDLKGNKLFVNNVYVLLAISTVFVSFIASNIGKFYSLLSLGTIYLMLTLIFLIINYFLGLVLKKNFQVSQCLTCLFIYLFFSYAYFCDEVYVEILHDSSVPTISFSIVWLVVVCALLLIYYYFLRFQVTRVFSKYLIGFAFLSQCLFCVHYLYLHSKVQDGFSEIKSFGTLEYKPNVYFFLVDGYPNTEVLQEIAGFDNLPFENDLRQRGFLIVTESFSNYHFTLASVSSQLMAQYHKIGNDNRLTNEIFSRIIGGDNNVVKTFKDNGYDFVFAPSGICSELESQHYEDYLISSPSLANDIYRNLFLNTILRKYSYILCNKYLEPQRLKGYIEKRHKKPYFLYAHFMQVHDLVLTDHGNITSGKAMTIQSLDAKKNLIGAIKSMNLKILDLIDCILKNDPAALIILNSDHGICTGRHSNDSQEKTDKSWNTWGIMPNNEQLKKRFKNFSAILISKNKRMLSMPIRSNVNIFRYIFGVLGLKDLPLIEDRALLLDYDEKGKNYYLTREVTAILNKKEQ